MLKGQIYLWIRERVNNGSVDGRKDYDVIRRGNQDCSIQDAAKNVKWRWSIREEQTFQNIKELLKSAKVLVHFNPDLELRLSVDASPVGIGAVLSHKFPSGEEKPIAFASKSFVRYRKRVFSNRKRGTSHNIWRFKI